MNMKKVLSALLVSAMAMSLTACGGSGGSDSAADASSSAASADGTTTIDRKSTRLNYSHIH